jgi:hypothetical protein
VGGLKPLENWPWGLVGLEVVAVAFLFVISLVLFFVAWRLMQYKPPVHPRLTASRDIKIFIVVNDDGLPNQRKA